MTGEIHKEEFVEAASTKEFWGQSADVIGCRDNEDRGLLFRHPGQERGEDSGRPGIGAAVGEPFFNLVDPEYDGGNGFRDGSRFADDLFGTL